MGLRKTTDPQGVPLAAIVAANRSLTHMAVARKFPRTDGNYLPIRAGSSPTELRELMAMNVTPYPEPVLARGVTEKVLHQHLSCRMSRRLLHRLGPCVAGFLHQAALPIESMARPVEEEVDVSNKNSHLH